MILALSTFVLVLGVSSCSRATVGGEAGSSTQGVAGDTVTPSVPVDPLSSLFPESLHEDLRNLQTSVDLFVETAVVSCMNQEGFEYAPMSLEQLRISSTSPDEIESSMFSAAENASSYLFVVAGTRYTPENQEVFNTLDDAERNKWAQALDTCYVSESSKYPNPLGELDESWYAGASERAADLTSTDSRLIEAEGAAASCVRELGYEDLFEEGQIMVETVAAISSEYLSGSIEEGRAREMLDEVAVEEKSLSEVFRSCEEPALAIERAVYVDYFEGIAQAEELTASEWVLQIQEKLKVFSEELAYLAETNN